MERRAFMKSVGAATLAAPMISCARVRLGPGGSAAVATRAVDVVDESIVVDMLHQLGRRLDREELRHQWLYEPGAFTEADFEAYRRSGITAISLGSGSDIYEGMFHYLAGFNGFIAAYPNWLARIDDASDFARAKREGKLGILITTQNSSHFREVDDVDDFFGLGQRVSQLTYSAANRLGNGAFEDPKLGLTEFGAQVIERMNRVGMAVDLGHGGDQTILDAMRVTKRPAIISHANCRALYPDYARNVTDEAIRALAATGGVIGINFISFMVKPTEPTTVDDVIDHIDHVRDLVGIEHVGIGSDFALESNDRVPDKELLRQSLAQADPRYRVHAREAVETLDGPERFYVLADALLRRGYTPEHIRLIVGGNFARVLSDIWTRQAPATPPR